MNKSDSIGKLAAALAKAQAAMDPAKKDTKGNFGKFADLGEVIDVIRKVATPNGLSFSQFPVGDAAGIGVATILMHESGEWLSDTIYLPTAEGMGGRNGAQLAGGNITYLRRYSLAAVFGVYADEDTDGNGTGQRRETEKKPAQAPRAEVPNPVNGPGVPVPSKQWTRDPQEWALFATVAKGYRMNEQTVRDLLQVTSMHDYKGTREQAEMILKQAHAATKQPA